MEEIIAKKANLLPGLIVAAVISVALLIGGIVLGISMEEPGAAVIGVGIGGILSVVVGIQIYKFIRQPKVLITYSDGKFNFPDGSRCQPGEITHILLKLTRGRYGTVSSTGGMVITVNGRKIELKNVDRVKQAEARISEICNGRSPAPATAPQEDNPYKI